jgi:molecular chaperone GrpE (heat shock protein)
VTARPSSGAGRTLPAVLRTGVGDGEPSPAAPGAPDGRSGGLRTLPAVSDAPEPADDPEPVIGSDGNPPDPITGSEDEAEPDDAPVEEAAEHEPVAGDEPVVEDVAPDEEPEPVAGVDLGPVLAEVAGVRAGVESMLPDLAATAREETVATGLAGVQRSLDEMVRLTRRADEHVAELHSENQRLRAGEIASATQPMIRDLVRLHDEVAQLASASHPEAQADLQLVGSRLLDTLARWGLSPFSPAAGEALDATRHQGVGRVVSADGAPGTIATVRRPGFAHDDGRTFRAAEVEVFVAPPEPAPTEPAPTEPAPTEPAPSEPAPPAPPTEES